MTLKTFSLDHKQLKRCDLFIPHGRIDSSTAPQLEESLKSVMKNGRYKLVLNLSDVNFLSSAALRVLISTAKECRKFKRGDIFLAETPPKLQEVFDLAGLDEYFKFFETEAEAVGSF
jgi:anti-sigma B factor antagonist